MTVACALLGAFLASCQSSGPKDYVDFRSYQDPVTTASRIAESIGSCWFGGERDAFAEYSYAPELTSYSNRPRVLIVPKDEPHGLPVLVVEAVREDRQTRVKLFGPLMAGSESTAIARDVERWAGGSTGCA